MSEGKEEALTLLASFSQNIVRRNLVEDKLCI